MNTTKTPKATQKAILYRRQKRLFCSYDRLTDFDVSTLLLACHNNLDSQDEKTLLLSSLITGRPITSLLDRDLDFRVSYSSSKAEGRAAFLNKQQPVPLDSLEARKEFALDSDTAGGVVLFPHSLADALQKVRKKALSSNTVISKSSQFLRTLNKQSGARLSLSRIANHLHAWCLQAGISETVYSALTGQDENYHSGNFYTRLSNATLLQTLRQYHDDIYKEHDSLQPSLPTINSKNFWGSRRVPKQEEVIKYFDKFKDLIDLARRIREWDILHNAMTLYCLNLMQVSTGVRPTNRLLGNLHAFDMDNRTIVISDKGEKSTRLIYLNNIAFGQLVEYCSFLRDIAKRLRFVASFQHRKIERKLAGRSNLFSLLKMNLDNTGKANRQMIKDSTFAYFPMPSNWHRHLLRTALESSNTPPHLMDYFFDHKTLVAVNQKDVFSNIAITDMKSIADTIESEVLEPLGLTGIRNPLGYKYDTRR